MAGAGPAITDVTFTFTASHFLDVAFTSPLCRAVKSMKRCLHHSKSVFIVRKWHQTCVMKIASPLAFGTGFVKHRLTRAETPPPLDRWYGVVERIQSKDPADWIALLEPSLPAHLRQQDGRPSVAAFDGNHVANILLSAQGPLWDDSGLDLLYHMGMSQGRWESVVWLVKQLVEKFAAPRFQPQRLSQLETPGHWPSTLSLKEMCDAPIILDRSASPTEGSLSSATPLSLHELTFITSNDIDQMRTLQHAILGQIWRSLGAMILASAEDVVKPEVLEIIAYLHHQGIMPASIYSRKPISDETAIQQPPTLHLLSSRILTSLSDAAWRAHEKIVVAEAKARGASYSPIRPEVPGSVYRVHVAGLRPEVWLELVLWSCLHGGWILEGASLLRSICRKPKPRQWRPFSWRTSMSSGPEDFPNWDKLDYMFKMRAASTRDPPEEAPQDVQRTVSSEVVNAYVDALLCTLDVGVGTRGTPSAFALNQLILLRHFLGRSRIGLGSGSWDAIVLRYYESQGDQALAAENFPHLLTLSPAFGREVKSKSTTVLPPYVLDGSAAALGLCHRALVMQIKSGNLEGAMLLFRRIQKYTDVNRTMSIRDFFNTVLSHENDVSAGGKGMFTGNFSKIDYPSFDLQIPPTTLGLFLNLLIDSNAYDLCRWCLFSDEVDGPLIPESLYQDPAILPFIVRFATATDDHALLSKAIQPQTTDKGTAARHRDLPKTVLDAYLDGQIELKSWHYAERILETMRDTPGSFWSIANLASVARRIILLNAKAKHGGPELQQDVDGVRKIFVDMATGKYDNQSKETLLYKPRDHQTRVKELILVLSTIGPDWATLCARLGLPRTYLVLGLPIPIFNTIVDAVAEAHGAVAARNLIGIFWSHSVRYARMKASGELLNAKYRPHKMDEPARQRKLVYVGGRDQEPTVIYGGVLPNVRTIQPVFRRALQRLCEEEKAVPRSEQRFDKSNNRDAAGVDNVLVEGDVLDLVLDTSLMGMVVWAARRLRDLGLSPQAIEAQLRESLDDSKVREVLACLPDPQPHVNMHVVDDPYSEAKPPLKEEYDDSETMAELSNYMRNDVKLW